MLRKVKLYGELADFVGHKELDAVITCTADAIRFLVSNFPKLEAHMSQRYYKVLVNNYEIREEDIQNPTGKSDIKIVPVISGSGGNFGKILLGGALIALSFGVGGIFSTPLQFGAKGFGLAAAGGGAKAAFGIGAALVLSGVSDMLFPVPDIPDFANEEDPRISFSFSGVQNTSRAGTSHPIAYGEIVTGSVVISAGIDTNQVTA
jgi:predicted phage tail protein